MFSPNSSSSPRLLLSFVSSVLPILFLHTNDIPQPPSFIPLLSILTRIPPLLPSLISFFLNFFFLFSLTKIKHSHCFKCLLFPMLRCWRQVCVMTYYSNLDNQSQIHSHLISSENCDSIINDGRKPWQQFDSDSGKKKSQRRLKCCLKVEFNQWRLTVCVCVSSLCRHNVHKQWDTQGHVDFSSETTLFFFFFFYLFIL